MVAGELGYLLGKVFSKMLYQNGIRSVLSLSQANPRDVESVCGRKPPFGNQIVDSARNFPLYELQICNINVCVISSARLRFKS